MADLKNFILEQLKKDSADDSAGNLPANLSSVEESAKNNESIEKIFENPMIPENSHSEELPIYTAMPAQINYWHACVNIHVGELLSRHDLNVGTKAFDAFKIGVDEEKHAATFALDDTHYLKFDLNDTNVRPIDADQAEKVLRKVNEMRFDRIKHYEQFEKYVTVRVLLESDET